jgi:hypothetical protein
MRLSDTFLMTMLSCVFVFGLFFVVYVCAPMITCDKYCCTLTKDVTDTSDVVRTICKPRGDGNKSIAFALTCTAFGSCAMLMWKRHHRRTVVTDFAAYTAAVAAAALPHATDSEDTDGWSDESE